MHADWHQQKKRFGGSPQVFPLVRGAKPRKIPRRTRFADAVCGALLTSGFEPARGPDGFVQIRFALFFCSQKGQLASTRDSVWLQSIYVQLAGHAGRTRAAAGIVPASAHVHLAVGDGRYREFDRVSRLISSRLQAIPQLTGLVMIGSAASAGCWRWMARRILRVRMMRLGDTSSASRSLDSPDVSGFADTARLIFDTRRG